MIRNSHNFRGSSAHAGYKRSRWRTVFIALVLLFTFGSTSLPSAARAAPANVKVLYSVVAERDKKGSICVGEFATIKVLVKAHVERDDQLDLEGVWVHRWVRGSVQGVGGLFPERTRASLLGDNPTAAKFTFRASKPGKATLTFAGEFPRWLLPGVDLIESNPVEVTVIPCKFKVKTVLSFNPGIYTITVISDEAVMTRDEAGAFTASSIMHWVYSNFSIPCSVSAADSSVDLTGNLDDEGGQFAGSETFGPVTPVGCGGSGGGAISPLQFKVASSGGVSTSSATAAPLSGSATIIVVPEEDQAVAFIPGSHEARWDDFSSLFGALLTLR